MIKKVSLQFRWFKLLQQHRYVMIAAAIISGCMSGSQPCRAQVGSQPAGALPVVWVLSTGGTISARGETSTSLTDYKSGTLLGSELVKSVPEIQRYATVTVEQVVNVRSSDLTVQDWLTLAKRINRVFAEHPEVAGVVVTHGTNTLEETAYFLNLTVKDERPVVLVGAMRPATAISADGPLNLLNAVRTACSPEARGKGVLTVLNDEISAARDVTKTSTYRVETFRSQDLGYLGYVDGDKVSFYRSPIKRHTYRSEFDVSEFKELPSVEIVYSYVQPSSVIIRALVSSGVRGIVFAGTGAGLLSKAETETLNAVLDANSAKRPVMVRSSRTGSGRVVSYPEFDKMGMVPADTLNPQKARILLMLALTKTRNVPEIVRMFSEY